MNLDVSAMSGNWIGSDPKSNGADSIGRAIRTFMLSM
jgi:hypothetical protein